LMQLVMVNHDGQLDHIEKHVPRSLVKHISGYICEGVSGED
jgi:hypothetical protein